MQDCSGLAKHGAPVLPDASDVLTGDVSPLQEALQQVRTLTSISADGLMAGGSNASGGAAGPGLDPQSSYGSYSADGGFGAADALAALGRMASGGPLTGDGHVLRSPGRHSQIMQQSSHSLQSAFGSAAAQQLHAVGSASRSQAATELICTVRAGFPVGSWVNSLRSARWY